VGLAERHRIHVIEDCAHSLGATVRQRIAGSFGFTSFFSFELTKPVNTFGGGMVVSKDAELIRIIRKETSEDAFDLSPFRKKLRAIKIERVMFSTGLSYPMLYLLASPQWKDYITRLYRRFQHAPPINIRYLPIQASVGLRKLQTIHERIQERKEKAELLRALLRPEISTQRIENGCESSWYFFVAILPREASSFRKKMLMHGIDAGIEDEIMDNCAALLSYEDCSNTNSIYSRAIVLPLYEGISERSIRKVARVLNKTI